MTNIGDTCLRRIVCKGDIAIMNIKGLKLNKEMISLLDESIDGISKNTLTGIESLNTFSWQGFNKEEFKNLLRLFTKLEQTGILDAFGNRQTFVFNYSTDVTELDIVTVCSYHGEPILIDLESKNDVDTSSVETKVIKQIDKRKNDHLPQLVKDKGFITIGFANNNFIKGYFFDGKQTDEINDIDKLKTLFSSLEEYTSVEDYLVQSSNLASISKIYKDIENGTYKFYSDTIKLSDFLNQKIGKDDAVIVYGNAGTGKSVLALKLFFENANAKFLMMNSKMYYSLNFNRKFFSSGRATFNSEIFLNSIDSNSISIVDECQRLSYETLVEIISKSKITFLFGDNRQVWQKNGTLLSAKDLKKKLVSKNSFNVSQKTITKTRRYSDETSKSLECLTGRANPKDVKIPSDYQINLFYDEKDFLDEYKRKDGIKKIYVPLNQTNKSDITIDNETFSLASYNDDDFSIWTNIDNYYGSTYHALSFDVDHSFVYLKNVYLLNQHNRQVLFYKKDYENDDDVTLFLNELNILFTRGKKSLTIYVSNIEAYLYLNSILKKMR